MYYVNGANGVHGVVLSGMSSGRSNKNRKGKRSEHRGRGDVDTSTEGLPRFDVVVILPDGREAAKVGDEYYLLKRGKPDFNQPVDPKDLKG